MTLAKSKVTSLRMPQGWEWLVLLVFGLLIFGRRLPEVGRSLGQGLVEFKRGLKEEPKEPEETTSGTVPPSSGGSGPKRLNQ